MSFAPSATAAIASLPELLAPAGNWDCARAAVENGADAIYFGLERFNARMRADNFTEADLPELMAFLHGRGVKGYVTLNTLIFAGELPAAEQYLRTIIAAGVDAAIVQDVGLCRLIRQLSPDFPIHASTQMTITSAAGVEFAETLGCQLVVLARECSLKDIRKIQQQSRDRQLTLPLEVFVHGALCVAYSGQCLTSEALGGRSANRGECAQACRMPYDLIADGQRVDLGDRRYLLSPQDLAGLDVLPDLVRSGVTSLKIEGRLKTPEYVANVTGVYRRALEQLRNLAPAHQPAPAIDAGERYNLEMAFSRGLFTGWLQGINNQALVHARFGKKRGVLLGEVIRVQGDRITLRLAESNTERPRPAVSRHGQTKVVTHTHIKPGDGVVFDNGHPDQQEVGGRIYGLEIHGREAVLTFGRRDFNSHRVKVGDRVWKTSDPKLDRHLRQSFTGETPNYQRPIHIEVHGQIGTPLIAIARDELGHIVQIESAMPLVVAQNQPLTPERLQEQLGRLGNTPFYLASLANHLTETVLLPVSELNRIRRAIVTELETLRRQPQRWQLDPNPVLATLLPESAANANLSSPQLIVLVRNLEQLQVAIAAQVETIYCEFEDPCQYQNAMQLKHQALASSTLFVAPPRITKPGERWILEQVKASNADGYLVRNYDHLQFFVGQRQVGDFSLNIANPLTATYFKQTFGLERLTASYDLNISQLEDLLQTTPPSWFEVTIHQRMPMFHMEHCVFCAFLSSGTDYTNCGRPCETHTVTLRDRTGVEHILQADAGCRNTVFNGTPQTGAEYIKRLLELDVRSFRLEFVNETVEQTRHTLQQYQALLRGELTGTQLWQDLKLHHQLGVTRGPLDTK